MTTTEKLTRLKTDFDNVYNKGYEDGKAEGGGSNIDILIDGSITEITSDVETVKRYAFYGCVNLVRAEFSQCKTFSSSALLNCQKLVDFSAPKAELFEGNVLGGCLRVSEVNLPNLKQVASSEFSNTMIKTLILPSLETATGRTFDQMKALEIFKAPVITSFPQEAFRGCVLLKAVIIENSTCTLSNINVFTGTPIADGTGFIYVPDDAVEIYKTATNWNTYASQIKCLSEIPQDILDELEA